MQVRDLLGDEDASVWCRETLEGLPNGNYLKPAVWAEHESRTEYFGVSLGVRSFVRPLYLYIKLSQLRKINSGHTRLKLEEVDAFQSMDRRIMIEERAYHEKSKYNKAIDPCKSCETFFGPTKNWPRASSINLPPFGNCAEYDIIRTENLDYYLASSCVIRLWSDVEVACKEQFRAFKELTKKLDGPGNLSKTEILQTYHTSTCNAKPKVLVFNFWRGEYKLIAQEWPPK